MQSYHIDTMKLQCICFITISLVRFKNKHNLQMSSDYFPSQANQLDVIYVLYVYLFSFDVVKLYKWWKFFLITMHVVFVVCCMLYMLKIIIISWSERSNAIALALSVDVHACIVIASGESNNCNVNNEKWYYFLWIMGA